MATIITTTITTVTAGMFKLSSIMVVIAVKRLLLRGTHEYYNIWYWVCWHCSGSLYG